LAIVVVVGLLVGCDFAERALLQRPVEFWRATIPVDLLVLGLWPARHERLTRARAAFRRWRNDNIVADVIIVSTAITAIGWAEWSGLLPFVPPPIAAVVFGGSALLAGAAVVARAKATEWRVKAIATVVALSQGAFAASELFTLHRPELGWGFLVACAAGAVAAIADLVVRAPNREQRRHQRQLTRVRSVPQER
jgi:hypothetical protein